MQVIGINRAHVAYQLFTSGKSFVHFLLSKEEIKKKGKEERGSSGSCPPQKTRSSKTKIEEGRETEECDGLLFFVRSKHE